jgi:hypothetical protein
MARELAAEGTRRAVPSTGRAVTLASVATLVVLVVVSAWVFTRNGDDDLVLGTQAVDTEGDEVGDGDEDGEAGALGPSTTRDLASAGGAPSTTIGPGERSDTTDAGSGASGIAEPGITPGGGGATTSIESGTTSITEEPVVTTTTVTTTTAIPAPAISSLAVSVGGSSTCEGSGGPYTASWSSDGTAASLAVGGVTVASDLAGTGSRSFCASPGTDVTVTVRGPGGSDARTATTPAAPPTISAFTVSAAEQCPGYEYSFTYRASWSSDAASAELTVSSAETQIIGGLDGTGSTSFCADPGDSVRLTVTAAGGTTASQTVVTGEILS